MWRKEEPLEDGWYWRRWQCDGAYGLPCIMTRLDGKWHIAWNGREVSPDAPTNSWYEYSKIDLPSESHETV